MPRKKIFMNQLGKRIARARGEYPPKKRRDPIPSNILSISPVKTTQRINVEIQDERKGTEDPAWEDED